MNFLAELVLAIVYSESLHLGNTMRQWLDLAPKIQLIPPILGEIDEENIEEKQPALNQLNSLSSDEEIKQFVQIYLVED